MGGPHSGAYPEGTHETTDCFLPSTPVSEERTIFVESGSDHYPAINVALGSIELSAYVERSLTFSIICRDESLAQFVDIEGPTTRTSFRKREGCNGGQGSASHHCYV